MARKEHIELSGAAGVLKGVAGALATFVKAHADIAVAAPVDPAETEKTMRTVVSIARAALVLQQLQAAEDRAEDRAADRAAKRASAACRARRFTPEEDEIDMNEQDPRLEDPKLMAEADAELERRLAELGLEIKAESLPRRLAKRPAPRGVGQLDAAKPQSPTPAH